MRRLPPGQKAGLQLKCSPAYLFRDGSDTVYPKSIQLADDSQFDQRRRLVPQRGQVRALVVGTLCPQVGQLNQNLQ
jgi:hypothetical protein